MAGENMPHRAMPFRVEYNEEYIAPGQELEVFAQHPERITIHDVTPIGNQLRVRYTVIWHQDAREAFRECRASSSSEHDGDGA